MGALQRQAHGRRRRLSANKSDVFVELVVQGNFVKVPAIDAASGAEGSIVGPANAPRDALSQAAVRKLQYVIAKKQG